MICTQLFHRPDTSTGTTVALNQDIGYLLLRYLDGLNAINFMEAVNGSEQFRTIQIIEERIFLKLFTQLINRERIEVSVPYLHLYLDTCSICEDGYLSPDRYDHGAPPVMRLFIHPTFTLEAFKHVCCTYKTPSFQCYARLLPLNTHSYAGNLILADYFLYKHSVGHSRQLNVHERGLFKGVSCFKCESRSTRETAAVRRQVELSRKVRIGTEEKMNGTVQSYSKCSR